MRIPHVLSHAERIPPPTPLGQSLSSEFKIRSVAESHRHMAQYHMDTTMTRCHRPASGRGAAQVTAQAQPFARGAPRGARPPMARARSQRIRVQPHDFTSTLLGVRAHRRSSEQDINKIDGEVLPAGCADGLRDDLARLFGACGCVSVREGPETNVPVRTKLRRELI